MNDDLALYSRLTSAANNPQTQLYNALGRNAGTGGNFFTKRASSIDNAIGTTGAALASAAKDAWENSSTTSMLQDNKERMNAIAKKYGYNTYHDVWDARDKAEAEGDQATVDFINNTINPELQGQATENKMRADEKAANYKDYVENNDVSKRINQDRGKFAGSAMNTLSTAFDVLSMAAGIPNGALVNAGQGAWEGVADELEQNGFENFDLNRAGQNALIGAASGAATGALNNTGLMKNLGQGKISQKVLGSKLGQKVVDNGLGRGLQTVGTGALRGAVSGAVGGATGAGLSAAMNNQDVIASALEGAKQGVGQGALAGGVMAGATGLVNKGLETVAPDALKAMQENQARNQSYGDTMRDQFKGAYNSGDSVVAENVLKPMSNAMANVVDGARTKYVNSGAINRLASGIEAGKDGTVKFARMSQEMLDDINNVRVAEGKSPMTTRQTKAVIKEINNHLATHKNDFGSYEEVARAAFDVLTGDNSFAAPTDVNTNSLVLQDGDRFAKSVALDDEAGIRSVSPRSNKWAQKKAQEREALLGSSLEGGNSPSSQQVKPESGLPISRSQATDTIISQGKQNVNPETEVYRTLTGDGGEERPFMAYGDSDLATGKTQKQNLLSKAGRAMEAAQVNATRKETRDIGIENSGELVDRLRKRTGYTSIEDQAAFGKELTGGENSLLDTIQRNAIGATEDGRARTVEIDKIVPEINKLIDEAPNTLISPSKKAEVRDAIMADLSNPGLDTIHKANNFKAAAKQQFLINDRTPNDNAKELGKLYTRVAELVDDASYAEIPKTQIEAMFETGAREARARAQVAKNNGNKKAETAYNNLANELDESPKTVQAYRSIKKDYVDINKLSKKTQQGATAWNNPLTMGSAITAAMMTGNPLTAVPAAWAAKTFAPAIGEAAINTAAKVGGKIADLGDAWSAKRAGNINPDLQPTTPTDNGNSDFVRLSNPSTQIYNAIGRNEGLQNGEQARTANYLADAVNQTNGTTVTNNGTLEGLVSPSMSGGATTSVYNNIYGTQSAAPMTFASQEEERAVYFFPPTGDYWSDMLSRAMRRAKNAEDYESLGALYEMYQDAVAKVEKQNSASSSQKLTATQQRANAAMDSLQRLANMTPDLGYNLSNVPIIGGIATFGGNDYESEATSLAQQIGYMVSGANIKESEAENIGKAYVPQPWDSEQTRQNKLRRAYETILQYQNGYATE